MKRGLIEEKRSITDDPWLPEYLGLGTDPHHQVNVASGA